MGDGSKRSVGRPRAKGSRPGGLAREEILLAAARLFAEQGYSGTSTREIAELVGIRQPSLFYHFSKKEDIFLALIDEAPAIMFDYLSGIDSRPGRAAVKFYELLRFDFLFLMTEPYRMGQLIVLPEVRSGKFRKAVKQRRDRIIRAYRKLIRQGISEGDFVVSDLNVTTHTIFGMGEAIWTGYKPSRSMSTNRFAEEIADLALRALLRRPGRLESIKMAATVPTRGKLQSLVSLAGQGAPSAKSEIRGSR